MNFTLPLATGLALTLASPAVRAQEHGHGLDPALRQEIRQIVREEIRAALADLHRAPAPAARPAAKAKAKDAPAVGFWVQAEEGATDQGGHFALRSVDGEKAASGGGWFAVSTDDDAPVQRVIKVEKAPVQLRWSLEAPKAEIEVGGSKLRNSEIEKLQKELRELESELKKLEGSIRVRSDAAQKLIESKVKLETLRKPGIVRLLAPGSNAQVIVTRDGPPEEVEAECCEEGETVEVEACCEDCGANCCETANAKTEAPKVIEINSVLGVPKKSAKKID